MILSKRQKLSLALAALALALVVFWAFDQCTPMRNILGIGGDSLVLTSVLMSFYDVWKHPRDSQKIHRESGTIHVYPYDCRQSGWPIHPQRLKISGFSRPHI